MPTYEYKCQSCEHRMEVFASMSEPPPAACETCGATELVKVLFPVAVHYKGSGFYSTDYAGKRSGATNSSESSESSGDSSPDSTPSTSSSGSSDSTSSSSSGGSGSSDSGSSAGSSSSGSSSSSD